MKKLLLFLLTIVVVCAVLYLNLIWVFIVIPIGLSALGLK